VAIADRVRGLAGALEERTGIAVRTSGTVQRLEVREQEFFALAGEVEDLALRTMEYGYGGRPQQMRHEARKRIAQQSRIALKFDPLARAEAQILADFSFGKGVPTPTASDSEVQKVIDEAWSDAKNQEILTSFQAQRKLSNELVTAGELFFTYYENGGRIRVGRRSADRMEAVITDPEDEHRPILYLESVRRFRWNFATDQPEEDMAQLMAGGRPKVRYWKHWRNYEDAERERQQGFVEDDEDTLPEVPATKLAKGTMYHVAINQTGDELRGNPPWAAALRYFDAMNVLTEAHVVMAQAASTFVARRTLNGTPKQVTKAAASVLGHLSELGAATSMGGPRTPADRMAFAAGSPAPAAPGSIWTQNQSDQLEALNLRSGAGEMQQSAQIVRAPIAAQSGFGQHYLGDPSSTNLATASTLELPSTMRIEGWQSLFEGIFRWFTDRAIEAALKAGRFGGLDRFPEDGPIGEMRLHEAEDRRAMSRRVQKDLSYEFVMPFPGRRQLPDVVNFVGTLADSFDPNGVSVALRRQLLRFAYEQIGIDNVGRAVLDAIPETPIEGGIGSQSFSPVPPAMLPGDEGGAGDVPGQTKPEGARPKGTKVQSTPPGEKPASEELDEMEWMPEELRQAAEEFERELADRFSAKVIAPGLAATLTLAPQGD